MTGSSLRLAYELRDDAAIAAAGTAAPQLSEEELVNRFVEEFDAEVLPPEEESILMPQPPNLNKMLEQAQAMLAQQQEAQEKLKSERSRRPPAAAWSRS